MERELSRAVRGNHQVGVILFDLDDFKGFNDTFGHAGGDLLLRKFGNLVKKSVRGSDIACRYGGDEFLLLLPEATLESTMQRAEQLRREVKGLRVRAQARLMRSITLSLGVATFPRHGSTAQELLQVADRAMYRAKYHGRNRVVVAEMR